MQYQRSKGCCEGSCNPNSRKTQAVEEAQAIEKEARELRRARIANGAEPSMQNGK